MNYLSSACDVKLQQWILGVKGYSPCPTADCYDISAMCNLLLILNNATAPGQVWQGIINPWGWNNVYTVRGGSQTKKGSALSDHAVSVIRFPDAMSQEGLVCDATFGPYYGDTTPETYLAAMTYNSKPLPGSIWGVPSPGNANSVYQPLSVDGVPFQSGPSQPPAGFLARREAFAAKVTGASAGSGTMAAPLPSLSDCPALKDFDLVAAHRFKTKTGSRRYAIFGDGTNTVYAELWESGGAAWDTFLDEGASAEFDTPFEMLAGADSWVTRRGSDCVEHLWIAGPVVARFRCFGDAELGLRATEWYRETLGSAAEPENPRS